MVATLVPTLPSVGVGGLFREFSVVRFLALRATQSTFSSRSGYGIAAGPHTAAFFFSFVPATILPLCFGLATAYFLTVVFFIPSTTKRWPVVSTKAQKGKGNESKNNIRCRLGSCFPAGLSDLARSY